MLLVQGDTTTAFLGALCAFYGKIPVGHVEAGLRTGDKYFPFPEEVNRRLITAVAEDAAMQQAITDGRRVEAEGAPARELALRVANAAALQAREEKIRLANKAAFKP